MTQEIKGYREVSEEQLTVINGLKTLSEGVGDVVDEMRTQEAIDQRWVSIAATHLQQGFMALTRAVAKPDGF